MVTCNIMKYKYTDVLASRSYQFKHQVIYIFSKESLLQRASNTCQTIPFAITILRYFLRLDVQDFNLLALLFYYYDQRNLYEKYIFHKISACRNVIICFFGDSNILLKFSIICENGILCVRFFTISECYSLEMYSMCGKTNYLRYTRII